MRRRVEVEMDLQILAAAPVDRRAAAVANMEGTECCVGSPRGGFPEREAKGLIWPPDRQLES